MKNLVWLFVLIMLLVGCLDNKKEIVPVENKIIPEIYTDEKVIVKSASATENQAGEDIYKALDGKYDTLYHSLWNKTIFPLKPVEIIFEFSEEITAVDYMLYQLRRSGDNGNILEMEVWLKTQTDAEFRLFKTINFTTDFSSKTRQIEFENGFKKPKTLKLVVKKGNNDYVSAAEFEFYQKNKNIANYENYFKDLSFSELKENVQRSELEKIAHPIIQNIALKLFDKNYENERIGNYKSYPSPSIRASANKTWKMGSYDNVTGIYAKKGEELIVFVDDVKSNMYLRVVDHTVGNSGVDFLLKKGANQITSPVDGLVYILFNSQENYYSKVHIATGTVNGYFDLTKDTTANWTNLINKASYSFFDIKGNRALLTYTTEDLKKYVTDAKKLIETYDELVVLEQEFMGFYKYNRVPEGRMYFKTTLDDNAYMYATGDHTAYHKSTMIKLMNNERLRTDSVWGPAHEVGHVHQLNNGLKWIGMTEVSNNIYSLYVQTSFGNKSRLITDNRYEQGFNEVILNQKPHGLSSSVWNKLVPFWQLELYYSKVKGYSDFYKDLHELIRNKSNPISDGECQLEFVKSACDTAKEDLTEFFTYWGFLSIVDQDINDYSTRRLAITQEQIDSVKNYIKDKGYTKPIHPVHFITDDNAGMYKTNEKAVVGTIERKSNTITATGFKNVSVFKIYENDKPIFLSPNAKFNIPTSTAAINISVIGVNGEENKLSENY